MRRRHARSPALTAAQAIHPFTQRTSVVRSSHASGDAAEFDAWPEAEAALGATLGSGSSSLHPDEPIAAWAGRVLQQATYVIVPVEARARGLWSRGLGLALAAHGLACLAACLNRILRRCGVCCAPWLIAIGCVHPPLSS